MGSGGRSVALSFYMLARMQRQCGVVFLWGPRWAPFEAPFIASGALLWTLGGPSRPARGPKMSPGWARPGAKDEPKARAPFNLRWSGPTEKGA